MSGHRFIERRLLEQAAIPVPNDKRPIMGREPPHRWALIERQLSTILGLKQAVRLPVILKMSPALSKAALVAAKPQGRLVL